VKPVPSVFCALFLLRNTNITWTVDDKRDSYCFVTELNVTYYARHAFIKFSKTLLINFTTLETTCGIEFHHFRNPTIFMLQWDLVCDRDLSATLALVLLGIGGLIGNYIFGYVQDGVGRKPAFFIYLFIQCVFGTATAFAQNFTTWVVCRVGVGFTVPAILGTPYVLGTPQPNHQQLL
jgi:MFS family permease